MAANTKAPKEETTAVAVKSPITQVSELLLSKSVQAQIKLALPKHVTADRLTRVALTALSKTPQLLDCDRRSLLGAIMQCAQLGLEPDGVLGHAFLIPFRNGRTGRLEAQFIAGYKGLIALARRSNEVKDIDAAVVLERDEFDYEKGDRAFLRHKVPLSGDRGNETHVWASVSLVNGGYHFEVMRWEDVLKVRDASAGYRQNPKASPWALHLHQMAKKTLIRRLHPYLPMCAEFQRASSMEDMADAGVDQDLGSAFEVDSELAAEATKQRQQQLAEQYKKDNPDAEQSDGDPNTEAPEPGSGG